MAHSCRACQSYAWRRLKVIVVNSTHTHTQRMRCVYYSDSPHSHTRWSPDVVGTSDKPLFILHNYILNTNHQCLAMQTCPAMQTCLGGTFPVSHTHRPRRATHTHTQTHTDKHVCQFSLCSRPNYVISHCFVYIVVSCFPPLIIILNWHMWIEKLFFSTVFLWWWCVALCDLWRQKPGSRHLVFLLY